VGTRLFVGNLPYSVDEEKLREVFGEIGNVETASIVTDRETGRSRGFGFVEMSNDDEARTATEKLNGQDLDGRRLTVNEARPREARGGGGGRGGSGGGRRDRW